jgi:hypothetical protein
MLWPKRRLGAYELTFVPRPVAIEVAAPVVTAAGLTRCSDLVTASIFAGGLKDRTPLVLIS